MGRKRINLSGREIANYIIENQTSFRETAKHFKVSKTTIESRLKGYIGENSLSLDRVLYSKVRCICCGKKNQIYKLGYCKSCYYLSLRNYYILKPGMEFSNDRQKELVEYFLAHQNLPKEELANLFKMPISTVYYVLRRYTIKKKKEI